MSSQHKPETIVAVAVASDEPDVVTVALSPDHKTWYSYYLSRRKAEQLRDALNAALED